MSKGFVGILGGGESGVGAALLAKKLGYDVLVSDFGQISEERKTELNKYQVPFEEGGHHFEILKDADLIVKSPGIPDHASIVQQLLEASIEVISEIEFAYRNQKGKIIGITGSNGKTTTTHLIYHILDHAGFDVAEVGNVGKSFARQLFESECEWYVIEISSFQLDGVKEFRANIALLLNITPDHLDRYDGKMERYAAAKMRIALNQKQDDVFIFNEDDPVIMKMTNDVAGMRTLTFGHRQILDNELIQIGGSTINVTHANLIGRHNQLNLIAATQACQKAGVTIETIQRALPTFKNDPHRLEIIGEWGNVLWINDSKATNVDSVYYALEAMNRPVIWIAGGQDKGNDYQRLQSFAQDKVKTLICLGVDNRKISEAFSAVVLDIKKTTQVNEAVHWAASISQPGDVVLLSPACASFDLFQHYKHRGDLFRSAVKLRNRKK